MVPLVCKIIEKRQNCISDFQSLNNQQSNRKKATKITHLKDGWKTPSGFTGTWTKTKDIMFKEITNKTWLLGLVNHTGLKDNYLWVIPSLSLEKHNIISFKENSIKKDFLKHKTVKTNDKIRRFGVVMTPLSRKIWIRSCKLQHLKRFWREELT